MTDNARRPDKKPTVPSLPITPDALLGIGFLTDDEKAAGEFCARIVGGSDDGWKQNSNADKPNDEIAELILSPVEDSEVGAWGVFIETYQYATQPLHSTGIKTVAVIELGTRTTMGEILVLCRALKAWTIRYPEGVE